MGGGRRLCPSEASQLCLLLCGPFVLTLVARQVHGDDVEGGGSKVSHLETLSS